MNLLQTLVINFQIFEQVTSSKKFTLPKQAERQAAGDEDAKPSIGGFIDKDEKEEGGQDKVDAAAQE